MKIKAYVVHEANGPYLLEDVELDEPKAGEVLVRNVATGICHTDEFGRSQGVPIPLPLVLGHEGAGIVERVGTGAEDLKPGDHVGITYAFDNSCDACKHGEPYYCENFNPHQLRWRGGDRRHHPPAPGRQGREHVLRPVLLCHPLCGRCCVGGQGGR
ncbi:alcohol dehydrogenase catalytic domain-containing protein [Olsenella sp. DNF00959]|uniref:alcohol dehydrogenase catalytic domain-containing protein n=1 Tax=Olsenella sp. DNF00959 TaxID=1476999 RepID=UPI000AA2058F|nr:alcohol dehydrogenase catalytic domain-containing protein [Olsenella sp. DNF00959]